MPPKKIVIDTDPGVDDIMAILLALAAPPNELQVLLISLTFGNIDVESCLRNIVSMFHVLELEQQWRLENSLSPGFTSLESCRPIVALGADGPLENVVHQYDYFHGRDGLSGVHTTAPHFTPTEMWKHLFTAQPSSTPALGAESPFVALPPNFKPSARPAHLELLDLLASHPPDTITLVAIGPLTNFALAAAADPGTFLRAHEVVVMGGAIKEPGNVTPVAEFNTFACAYSAARVYALTSPSPVTVMPRKGAKYDVEKLADKRLSVTMFPLDITTRHPLNSGDAEEIMGVLSEKGSPLAQWVGVFMKATFGRMESVYSTELDIALHDPLTVWYVLTKDREGWVVERDMDVRVETEGQWTRGMCVVDRRGKRRIDEPTAELLEHDVGGWLHAQHGNRLNIAVESPDRLGFGIEMLERIFKG